MNKKALIIIAVVLVLGVGAYFYSKSKSGTTGTGGEISSGVKSLKDLIAANVPQKCTFTSSDESGKTEGATYIAGGKVRGDFTNTISGKTTNSHMISDGKTNYIWTDGEKNGFKMTVEETEAGEPASPSSEEASVSNEADLNQKADYKCSAWLPDNSLFSPPSNVTFTDFSEMFKAATPAPDADQGSTQSACAYCNTLSGDEKSQCLSSLNCQ